MVGLPWGSSRTRDVCSQGAPRVSSRARVPCPSALQTGEGSEDGCDAVRLEDEALGHRPPLPRGSGVHTHAELGSAGEAGVGSGLLWSSVCPPGGDGDYLLQIQEVLLTPV